jgi:hypothetical protein
VLAAIAIVAAGERDLGLAVPNADIRPGDRVVRADGRKRPWLIQDLGEYFHAHSVEIPILGN